VKTTPVLRAILAERQLVDAVISHEVNQRLDALRRVRAAPNLTHQESQVLVNHLDREIALLRDVMVRLRDAWTGRGTAGTKP